MPAEDFGGGEDIRSDDFPKMTLKVGISELNPIKRLEFLTKILLQAIAIPNILTIFIFETFELIDKLLFNLEL
jgi:hypothetical protein